MTHPMVYTISPIYPMNKQTLKVPYKDCDEEPV